MQAFITKRNNPKVKIVMGSVNKTIIGLTKKLSNASTTATAKAVVNWSMITPVIKYEITITSSAVNKILINRFISLG